ncbi:MAG: SDR family oxidoreductase [Planctomycetota bacterium]
MSSTLVTGASGFLGAHVVAAAVARARTEATRAEPYGPPVHAVSRSPALLAPRFSEPRDAALWVERDLSGDGARALLDERSPTEVVHCAALARAGDCERDPGLAHAVNVELSQAVAEWCEAHGSRLVHVSTDQVFGVQDAPDGGFDEDAEPGPLSVYGESKLASERAVRAACPDAAVVRLPLLYGNSGGRGLGASDAILEAVERDERPRLFTDEWRTPLEVGVAAAALVELLDFEGGGVLHVAGPERVSRYGFGLSVLAAMGLEREEAEAAVRATTQAAVDAGAPRARDVSLSARRAQGLLETELVRVVDGLARAIG